jgi:hypothetical protein
MNINKNLLFLIAIIFLTAFTFYSCEDKLDLSKFPITNNGNVNVSDTVYVQQQPVWSNFNGPEDVLVGNEPVIYVADTKNNSVVQLDLSGGYIGNYNFGLNIFPKKISQDGFFDLLVICDSVSTADTISILYRLKIVTGGGIINNAPKIELMLSTIPTPNSSKLRKFTGITVFNDNSYIVTRRGPEDPYGIDPGNALLKLYGRDSVSSITILSGFQSSGNSFYSIENVASIVAVKNSSTDFIISRSTKDTVTINKVIWFQFNSVNGSYDPKFTSQSEDIVNIKFGGPDKVIQDIGYNVYIIDSYRNHLYKFNSIGRLLIESFGTYGSGENQFINPKGISHFNKVLYIADTGNNRIVRYKLSTDIN